MFTELELKTEDIQPIVDFDEMQKVWEITMDSKLLHEFLFELEGYGADTVALRVIPDTSFQFRAQGQAGSLQVHQHSAHVFTTADVYHKCKCRKSSHNFEF